MCEEQHQHFYALWAEDSLLSALAWARSIGLDEEALQRCPRHGDPLKVGVASLQHGKPRAEVLQRMKKESVLLPFQNRRRLAGCVKDPDQPSTVPVIYCPSCRSFFRRCWWRCVRLPLAWFRAA